MVLLHSTNWSYFAEVTPQCTERIPSPQRVSISHSSIQFIHNISCIIFKGITQDYLNQILRIVWAQLVVEVNWKIMSWGWCFSKGSKSRGFILWVAWICPAKIMTNCLIDYDTYVFKVWDFNLAVVLDVSSCSAENVKGSSSRYHK